MLAYAYFSQHAHLTILYENIWFPCSTSAYVPDRQTVWINITAHQRLHLNFIVSIVCDPTAIAIFRIVKYIVIFRLINAFILSNLTHRVCLPYIYACPSSWIGEWAKSTTRSKARSESKSKPTHICQTPKHDWNRSLNKNANLEATKKRVSGKQHTICRQLAAVASIAFKRLPHIYNDLKDTVETSAHILVAKTGSTSYTKNEHSGYRCDVFKYWPN